MSWKFAELKWRQDLGIYESWDGRDVEHLPLERKRAIRVFEKRHLISQPHRRSMSLQHFPKKQLWRSGSNSEVTRLPALPAPASQKVHNASIREESCKQNQKDSIQPVAGDCVPDKGSLPSVQRSHSTKYPHRQSEAPFSQLSTRYLRGRPSTHTSDGLTRKFWTCHLDSLN